MRNLLSYELMIKVVDKSISMPTLLNLVFLIVSDSSQQSAFLYQLKFNYII